MAKGVYLHKPENYPPSRKGVKLTDEHKRKVSEALKGNTWNRGRKHSQESSKLKSEHNAKYWLGKKRPNFPSENMGRIGRPVSSETRAKIAASQPRSLGPLSPHWKDEKKRPLYKAIRENFKYRIWRTAIFSRDNFTCTNCGATKVYLEADHYPIRFVDILRKNGIEDIEQAFNCEELWDINNGRTLCRPCHLKTPTWGHRLQSK